MNGNNRKIVALIPLRGGSKSIPYKNIAMLNGHPLCYYTLKAACECSSIDEVYVSTEDEKIANVVQSLDKNVKIHSRPLELACDNSSTESVMLDFLEKIDADYLVLLQATSPFTQSAHLFNAIDKFFENGYDSMVSGVIFKRFLWEIDGPPINYNVHDRPRRQDYSGLFLENGAFYILNTAKFFDNKCRLFGKIGQFEMPSYTMHEIDEPEDWNLIEYLLPECNAQS